MSDEGHAKYIEGFRLMLLPDQPKILILKLETSDGGASYFAMPKAGSATVFSNLALDAQALESGAPMPSSRGSGQAN